jgi:multiple inositol-polyphosphate phosphatase / 2,3-bisphosphoglycerate 3-phosphatase
LDQLCADDLELLKKWRFDQNLTSTYGDYLTVQGWNDLKYMALDYQRTFQTVFDERYSPEKFKFGYSDTQRTEASYKAFLEGLFGPNADSIIHTSPEGNNSILLRPYESCPEFDAQSEKAKDKDSEYVKFQQTDVYKKAAEAISTRLGYKYVLNAKQIDTIWDMCRFDQAWYLQDESPWCAAFTPEHVYVLEYLEDLKYYYKASYGSYLSSNLMCAAVKDMVVNLKSEQGPKVVAYFSHASAIQLFLTSLGYAQDKEPLRADNYQQMKYRKFRASVWSPFASNLAVVKYE